MLCLAVHPVMWPMVYRVMWWYTESCDQWYTESWLMVYWFMWLMVYRVMWPMVYSHVTDGMPSHVTDGMGDIMRHDNVDIKQLTMGGTSKCRLAPSPPSWPRLVHCLSIARSAHHFTDKNGRYFSKRFGKLNFVWCIKGRCKNHACVNENLYITCSTYLHIVKHPAIKCGRVGRSKVITFGGVHGGVDVLSTSTMSKHGQGVWSTPWPCVPTLIEEGVNFYWFLFPGWDTKQATLTDLYPKETLLYVNGILLIF